MGAHIPCLPRAKEGFRGAISVARRKLAAVDAEGVSEAWCPGPEYNRDRAGGPSGGPSGRGGGRRPRRCRIGAAATRRRTSGRGGAGTGAADRRRDRAASGRTAGRHGGSIGPAPRAPTISTGARRLQPVRADLQPRLSRPTDSSSPAGMERRAAERSSLAAIRRRARSRDIDGLGMARPTTSRSRPTARCSRRPGGYPETSAARFDTLPDIVKLWDVADGVAASDAARLAAAPTRSTRGLLARRLAAGDGGPRRARSRSGGSPPARWWPAFRISDHRRTTSTSRRMTRN